MTRPEPSHDDLDCILCEGTHWVAIPDPLFDGALVDQRCPACTDHSVRAIRTCFENDWGQRHRPTGGMWQ